MTGEASQRPDPFGDIPESDGDGNYGWPDVANEMSGWHPALQERALPHLQAHGIVPFGSEDSVPLHGPESFEEVGIVAGPEAEQVKVTQEDLRPPEDFKPGEALIALVTNARDIRDPADGEVGELDPDKASAFTERIDRFMDSVYNNLPESDRERLDVVVLAGDTRLVTPGEHGIRSDAQRAIATGRQAISGIRAAMDKYGVPEGRLISAGDDPVDITQLRDLNMLHDDNDATKAFLAAMHEKHGAGREFFAVYEDDTEQQLREEYGVEGPDGIAQRTAEMVATCSDVAEACQDGDLERRVIVFAIGHYDNFSPWVKQHVLGMNPAEGFVPMEKGGGLVIQQAADGTAQTSLGGKSYPVSTAL